MGTQRLNAAEQEVFAAMREAFPLVFQKDDKPPRPLAIDIRQPLLAWAADQGVSEKLVGRVLKRYCLRVAYKQSLTVPGKPRIDLQGRPVGSVTAEAAELARQYIANAAEAQRLRAAKKQAAQAAHAAKQVEAKAKTGKDEKKAKTDKDEKKVAQPAPPVQPASSKPAPTVVVKKRRVVPPR